MPPQEDANQQAHEAKVFQIEHRINNIEAAANHLSLGQIKELIKHVGIPVAVGAGIFGTAVWIVLSEVSQSAAERQAQETVDRLRGDIDAVSEDISELQSDSEQLFENLVLTEARAVAAAEQIRNRVVAAEVRSAETQGLVADIQRSVDVIAELQQSLENVESIAAEISGNESFQETVSGKILSELGPVRIFGSGVFRCDARGRSATRQWTEICRQPVNGSFPDGFSVMFSVPYFYSRSGEIPPIYSIHAEIRDNSSFDIVVRTAYAQLNEMRVHYIVLGGQ